jgi:hypothetical protein
MRRREKGDEMRWDGVGVGVGVDEDWTASCTLMRNERAAEKYYM